MLEKLNSFFSLIIGDKQDNTLEHRLFSAVSFLAGTGNIIGAAFLMTDMELFLLQVISGVLFLALYYLCRFQGILHQLYWPFVFLVLSFLFLNTLKNSGTMGGAHYYLLPALVMATMLSSKLSNNLLALALFFVAAGGLVLIEMFFEHLITTYPGPAYRLQDVGGNFLFALVFTWILVLVLTRTLNQERQRSERLLLNILPDSIASELKRRSKVEPRLYEQASVMFTDFVGFTRIAEGLTPRDLIQELDHCFSHFDEIVKRNSLEKIKTIGDSYMVVGGVPFRNTTHAVDCVLAAFEILRFMLRTREKKSDLGLPYWDIRLGINTGALIAGVIGREKFAYDVWGDTVNTASRLETGGVSSRVNISKVTYEQVKDFFECDYRGKIAAKNKGEIDMYFANQIHPELSEEGAGLVPNENFRTLYRRLAEDSLPAAGEV